jgi:hypothetical protein
MAPRQARFCSFQAIVREWASDVAGDLDNATRVAPGDGLDRLAPAREAAQIAATLRRRFSHELISAIAAMPQEIGRRAHAAGKCRSWCLGNRRHVAGYRDR